MNLKENKIDELNREVTLEIAAEDYMEIEKKKLAERRRTADFKGFRKGMVPASMIKRVFGEQCLVEAVNEVISTSLDKYITDSKLHILGEPLTSEKQPEVEWVDGGAYTFVFDIANAPEIEVSAEKSDEVPSYTVSISAKEKAPMIDSMKKYYEEKKETRTEEEITAEVTERMTEQYRNEADWRLTKDIRDYFIKKADVKIPEAFLKRWLVAANNGKYTKEDVEKEFAGFAEDFKWQLVRGYLLNKYEIKITEEDIRQAAESYVSYQYAMYGIANVPEAMVKEASVNMLQDQKQVERLAEQVEDQKVIARIKEEITIKPTKITAAKFRELK